MTTAATSLLGLALPVTGELSGTWGSTVNDSITSLLDTAVAGTTTLSTDADVTLTTTTLASNQARQAILLCSGARTALRTITAPAQSKIYTIINATTGGYSVKLVGVGPTTGLTIPNGASAVVAWNGSDFIEVGSATVGNLTVNGNLSVTGTTSLTGVATLTANPVLSAGTANGVAYLNGSKVVTTGSALTFNGTDFSNTAGKVIAGGDLRATSSGTGNIGLNLARTGGTTADWYNYIPSGSTDLRWYLGSDLLFLNSSGNLGLGVTPSAWSTSQKALQVGTTASLFNASNGSYIGNNVYNNSTPAATFITTGYASAYGQSAGVHSWYTSTVSGSAGGAVTWTNSNSAAMTLDASGNLGIGTTTDTGRLNLYTAANETQIKLRADSGQGSTIYFTQATSGFNGYINYNNTSNYLSFATNGSERARIDSSGNLLVGGTSATPLSGVFGISIGDTSTKVSAGMALTTTNRNWLTFTATSVTYSDSYVIYDATAGLERARIDTNGNLLVGKTASGQVLTAGFEYNNTANAQYLSTCTSASANTALWVANNGSTGTRQLVYFYAGGSSVGSITSTGSSTTYATSSDYRLKENIAPMQNALAKVKQLKPVTYKWKSDGSDGEGFIAHELAEVCPHAVTGKKDAVDDEGNLIYQGVDPSKVVALLTAAIQELTARLEKLEAA